MACPGRIPPATARWAKPTYEPKGAVGTEDEVTNIRPSNHATEGGKMLFDRDSDVLSDQTKAGTGSGRGSDPRTPQHRHDQGPHLPGRSSRRCDRAAEDGPVASPRPGRGRLPRRKKASNPVPFACRDVQHSNPSRERQYTPDAQTLNRRVEVEATNTLIDDLQDKPARIRMSRQPRFPAASRLFLSLGHRSPPRSSDFQKRSHQPPHDPNQANHQAQQLPHRQPAERDIPKLLIRLAREFNRGIGRSHKTMINAAAIWPSRRFFHAFIHQTTASSSGAFKNRLVNLRRMPRLGISRKNHRPRHIRSPAPQVPPLMKLAIRPRNNPIGVTSARQSATFRNGSST